MSLTTICKVYPLEEPLGGETFSDCGLRRRNNGLIGISRGRPAGASVPEAIKKEPAPYQCGDPITLARTGSRRELLLLMAVL